MIDHTQLDIFGAPAATELIDHPCPTCEGAGSIQETLSRSTSARYHSGVMDITDRIRSLINAYGLEAVAAAVLAQRPIHPVGSAPARHGDPSTSHAAARKRATTDVLRFSSKSRKAKLLRAFSDPATDHEATIRIVGELQAHDTRFEGTRRRCSDLRPKGYIQFIEDSGQRRINPGSDVESVVWRLSVAGHQALHSLIESGWSR